jgi:ATP-dependent Clp protease adapter protein ClpS
MKPSIISFFALCASVSKVSAFGFVQQRNSFDSITSASFPRQTFGVPRTQPDAKIPQRSRLYMSDAGGTEQSRSTKKGVSTILKEKVETKQKEDLKDEDQWRVLLHNDEVHTFQYVVQSLVKVIGTVDRKAAYEICVQTHNSGKGSVTKTWKKQAMKFCLGLQRQGLTASIAPDKNFKGGGKGGDDGGDGGGGGDE